MTSKTTDKRVRERLATAGKAAVIPPMPNRRKPPDFDRELYKARHLVENFLQFRAIATRYDKTARSSSPPFASPPLPSGSIDDTP